MLRIFMKKACEAATQEIKTGDKGRTILTNRKVSLSKVWRHIRGKEV